MRADGIDVARHADYRPFPLDDRSHYRPRFTGAGGIRDCARADAGGFHLVSRRAAGVCLPVNQYHSVAGVDHRPPFVAWVTLSTGWRWAFFIPAMAGVVVGILWFISSRKTPPAAEDVVQDTAAGVPLVERYKMVLTSKPIWALLIARLLTDPFWFFYQYWQVGFMQEKIGLTLAEVGKLMWLPPLVAVFGVLAVCWASDRLVARGMDATRARLTIIWSVTCLAPLVFLLPSISNAWAAVAIMTVINFMCTAWLSMATIMMGGLAPRVAIATAIGVMSALGGVTSIIFNGFVGSIIDHFGYSMPIYAGATLHPIGALVLAAFFLRRKKSFIARPETV
ncbi:hypothetical protein CEW81_00160 [Kluyvera genomosp. 3]|uniref:MFS transporter n=1 Tax=Kluyvera genomosp. 3 TaxID=2774055 RepID=A0A248KGC4_9ENTR|nr:hypothetical protein CEW81_00160 [Kluyvera genomosp. 3]